MGCTVINFESEYNKDPFYSYCERKPHSTEFLEILMNKFVEEENYEAAALYRDEILKRSKADKEPE